MKELSIEQKARAYDRVSKEVKDFFEGRQKMYSDVTQTLEYLFPELKESEDDRIRKALIEMVHDTTGDALWVDYNVHKEECIAWLEKQKTSDKALQYLKENHSPSEVSDFQAAMNIAVAKAYDKGYNDGLEKQGEHANFLNKIQIGDKVTRNRDGVLVNLSQLNRVAKKQGEQKPADKNEPKFNIGDLITNGIIIGKVDENDNNKYHGWFGYDKDLSVHYADIPDVENWHLWTIQDAKDGDVLSYVKDEEDLWIMIYRSLYEPYEGHVHYHALLVNDNFTDKGTCCICIDDLKPATKEQRALLFQKMKEAGYEWDAEKKELKKIEQKTVQETKPFEAEHGKYYYCIKDYFCGGKKQASKGDVVQALRGLPIMGLKDASEYFLPVNFINCNSAWSEEDEMFVHGLIRGLAAKRDIHGHTTFSSDCIDITETIHWLESLKNRVLLYPVSVEYNEEDIDNIADTFIPEPVWNALEESKGEGSNAAAYDYSQMIAMFKAGVHWFESIKDRVQPQSEQEWGEEDVTHYNRILKELTLQKEMPVNTSVIKEVKSDIIWFKSLRPQNRWKPDKTTLDTLQLIIYHPYSMSDYQQEILINLLEQLEKLTE